MALHLAQREDARAVGEEGQAEEDVVGAVGALDLAAAGLGEPDVVSRVELVGDCGGEDWRRRRRRFSRLTTLQQIDNDDDA